MASPAILFSFWRSSCAWRVRLALTLKQVPFEQRFVDLNAKAQHADEYKQLNPSGKVPLIIIDGVTIGQSVAILEYLEATRPEPRLIPADPKKAALVRQLVQIIVSDTHPLQSAKVCTAIATLGGDKDAWAAGVLKNSFAAIETLLARDAGQFCVGDELTLADVCLAPQAFNAARFNVDLAAFPNLNRIYQSLMQRADFSSTNPKLQPDFKEE